MGKKNIFLSRRLLFLISGLSIFFIFLLITQHNDSNSIFYSKEIVNLKYSLNNSRFIKSVQFSPIALYETIFKRFDNADYRIFNFNHSYLVRKFEIIRKFALLKPRYFSMNLPGIKTRIKTNEKVIALTFDACGGKKGRGFDKKLIDYLKL